MSDPTVLRAIPVLQSLDLQRTLAFSVEKLGFAVRIDLDDLVGLNLITFAEELP